MRSERGSALLIVFVFAAIVAIMLYRALPDAMFEGQRQKEQLLIDRGNEYKTAIKRFLVRNKTYPTSLDQLDNFNNVRYIRHRFKDPMTGKQEWRMIHVMNPGFILTDSKVKPLSPNQVNSAGGFGATNTNSQGGFGSTGNAGSGSNNTGGFGSPNANASSFGSSSTRSNTGDSSTTQQPAGDPNAPPAPTAAQLYGAQRRPAPVSAANLPGGEQPPASDPLADKPLPEPAPASNGQTTAANPSGLNNPQVNPGAPGAPPDPNNPAPGGIDAVNSSLRRQGPTPTPAFGASNSQGGGIKVGAGAIAGVASTATGSTIKIIDGQTDYSKWEFVYNPQNDAASKMQSALGNNNANQNGINNQNTGGFSNNSNQQNNSGSSFGNNSSFGSSTSSSFGSGNSFGGNSFGSSTSSGGFGSSNSAPRTQTPPVSQ